MTMTKTYANFRLSAEARELLTRVADREGTTRTAVIEALVRRRAEELGLRPPPARKSGKKPRVGG